MNYYLKNKTEDGKYILSSSSMQWLEKSARHFKAYCDGEIKFKTPSLNIGRVLHAMILEPEKLYKSVEVKHGFKGEGSRGLNKLQKELAEKKGVDLISQSEFIESVKILSRLQKDKDIRRLVNGCQAEFEIFTDIDGVPAKGKIDLFKRSTVIDFKFVLDASEKYIKTADYTYNLDRQQSFYRDMLLSKKLIAKNATQLLIVVEKSPPYEYNIIEIAPDIIDQGRDKYKRCIEIYKNTVAKGLFPGYGKMTWTNNTSISPIFKPEKVENVSMDDIISLLNAGSEDLVFRQRYIDITRAIKDPEKKKFLQKIRIKPNYFGNYYQDVLNQLK